MQTKKGTWVINDFDLGLQINFPCCCQGIWCYGYFILVLSNKKQHFLGIMTVNTLVPCEFEEFLMALPVDFVNNIILFDI